MLRMYLPGYSNNTVIEKKGRYNKAREYQLSDIYPTTVIKKIENNIWTRSKNNNNERQLVM